MKKLGFGMMRLPLIEGETDAKKIDIEQVKNMVDYFISQGYTYFDTAYMYHDFTSENVVKEALTRRYPRDKFVLADKLPSMFLKEEGDQERIFAEQLDKCGVNYFDYYLIHCLNKENYAKAQKFDSFGFAQKMKSEGKINKLGFSFHDTDKMLEKIITEHPEVEFVQLQINYLDWLDDGVRAKKCYDVARKYGKEIIIMEPVKGGILANLPFEAKELLKNQNPKLSPAEWALNFVHELSGVVMILSGMSNMAQLTQNTALFDDMGAITPELFELLTVTVANIIKKPKTIACTGCSYCTDGCPKKINIPAIFSAYNKAITSEEGERGFTKAYRETVGCGGEANDCLKCGKCEKICPQKLEIIQSLGKIAEILEK